MGADRATLAVPPHVLDYLRQQNTLTLATATAAGVPHATTLTYVNDDLTLYCWMRPESLTLRHIDENPAVAFTIDDYAVDWSKTKGIQGSGQAQVLLNPSEIDRAVALFAGKYAHLTDARTSNVSFFRITPSAIRFIDNEASGLTQPRQGFGVAYRYDVVYSVFQDLPREEVDTIAGRLDTQRIDRGAVIVRQGAPADKFFIIVDGEVEVIRDEQTVATLQAGQFFGELAILRDIPRTATVRATAPTTLLTMERDAFRTLVAQSLATTRNFDQVIQQRLSDRVAGGPR